MKKGKPPRNENPSLDTIKKVNKNFTISMNKNPVIK
jgi:DNA-binding phage protein